MGRSAVLRRVAQAKLFPLTTTTTTLNGDSIASRIASTVVGDSVARGNCHRNYVGGNNANERAGHAGNSHSATQFTAVRGGTASFSRGEDHQKTMMSSSSTLGMMPGVSGYAGMQQPAAFIAQQRIFKMPFFDSGHSSHFQFPTPTQSQQSDTTSLELAQELANQGNAYFAQHNYHEALRLYSEAIKLDPHEARFYGNRGYCYEVCGSYESALEDAERAIALQPSWPKGYYRKGCALEKMKRWVESERAFDQLLRHDSGCAEAREARYRVMTQQLVAMGLSNEQSEAAVRNYGSVKAAADSVIQTRLNSVSALSEVFDSDDEEALLSTDCWSKASTCSSSSARGAPASVCHTSSMSSNASSTIGSVSGAVTTTTSTSASTNTTATVMTSTHRGLQPAKSISPPAENVDPLMDPKNPLRWPTLWVGNLTQQADEKELNALFSRFGKMKQFQLMIEKHCAFLTYTDWKQAGEAMRQLQGLDVKGQKLLVRFPDRALESTTQGSTTANANAKGVKAGTAGVNNASHNAQTRPGDPPHSAVRGTVILRKSKK